ncbi:hypothetical protein I2709_003844 [Vibrio mimicus]
MRLFIIITIFFSQLGIAKEKVSNISEQCKNDLEFTSTFLMENDAGAEDHISVKGKDYYLSQLDISNKKTQGITSWPECHKIMSDYIKSWRKSHLYVEMIEPALNNYSSTKKLDVSRSPTLEKLSSATVLLTVPSFNHTYKQQLNVLLEDQSGMLSRSDNWIIDLRENDGGSDSTYEMLLTKIMDNQYNIVGTKYLVSEENIKIQRSVCDLFMLGDKQCEAHAELLAKRMEDAPLGSFISQYDSYPNSIFYGPEPNVGLSRPNKVAILIGQNCGSSCEQFLLAAKQSFNVKLVGRKTAGALDYSNLRPKVLPSGKLKLHYAVTKSQRLPYLPVDLAGILPDVYLPLPNRLNGNIEEIMTVKTWLETGLLAK